MLRSKDTPFEGGEGFKSSRSQCISLAPCLAIFMALLFFIPIMFVFWDLTDCASRSGVVTINKKAGRHKNSNLAEASNLRQQTPRASRPDKVSNCRHSVEKIDCLGKQGAFQKRDEKGFTCAGRSWSALHEKRNHSFSATDVKAGHLWNLQDMDGHSFFYKIECRPTLHQLYHFGAHGYTDFIAFLLAEFLDLDVVMPCTEFLQIPIGQLRNNTPVPSQCIFEDSDSRSPYTIGAMSSGLSSLRPMEWLSNEEVRYFATAEVVPRHLKPYLEDVVKIAVLDYLALNDDRHCGTYNTLFSLEYGRPVFMDAGAFSRFSGDICGNHTTLLKCPSVLRTTKFRCAEYNGSSANFCLFSEYLMRKIRAARPADFIKRMQVRFEGNNAWQSFLRIGGTDRAPDLSKLLARKVGTCAPSQHINDPGEITAFLLDGAAKRLSLLWSHLQNCIFKEELSYVLQLDS